MNENVEIFVGRQLWWKDHLVFICNAVCMYGWMSDLVNIKRKTFALYENAMPDFRQTWYVGIEGSKYYPLGLSSPNAHIKYLICISNPIG